MKIEMSVVAVIREYAMRVKNLKEVKDFVIILNKLEEIEVKDDDYIYDYYELYFDIQDTKQEHIAILTHLEYPLMVLDDEDDMSISLYEGFMDAKDFLDLENSHDSNETEIVQIAELLLSSCYDYTAFSPKPSSLVGNCNITKLTLEQEGKVIDAEEFSKLDDYVKGLEFVNPTEVIFTILFSDNSSFTFTYELTPPDITYFSSKALLCGYAEFIRSLFNKFGEKMLPLLSEEQTEALAASYHNWGTVK